MDGIKYFESPPVSVTSFSPKGRIKKYAFQVQEFANGFAAMREMGFPTNAVAEALFMFDNDTDKALSHLLHGSS